MKRRREDPRGDLADSGANNSRETKGEAQYSERLNSERLKKSRSVDGVQSLYNVAFKEFCRQCKSGVISPGTIEKFRECHTKPVDSSRIDSMQLHADAAYFLGTSMLVNSRYPENVTAESLKAFCEDVDIASKYLKTAQEAYINHLSINAQGWSYIRDSYPQMKAIVYPALIALCELDRRSVLQLSKDLEIPIDDTNPALKAAYEARIRAVLPECNPQMYKMQQPDPARGGTLVDRDHLDKVMEFQRMVYRRMGVPRRLVNNPGAVALPSSVSPSNTL